MTARASLPFAKAHGLGNDYLLLDAFRDPDLLDGRAWIGEVPAMCDRRRGVGADGVILFGPGDAGTDALMRIVNADGSPAPRCGNGARCVARLLFERGYVNGTAFTMRSGDDVLGVEIAPSPEGGFDRARIDMGAPVHDPDRLPVDQTRLDRPVTDDGSLVVDGREGWLAGVGNAHLVLLVDDDAGLDAIGEVGPPLERHAAFPDRINVHLAHVSGRRAVQMVSWERGAGATLACGTGACAVFSVAHRRGLVDDNAVVTLPGGDLLIERDESSGRLVKTGPAEIAFLGEWPLGAGS